MSRYKAPRRYDEFGYSYAESNWLHIGANTDEITLAVNISNVPPDDNHTLVVTIGIRYGTVGDNQNMRQVARVGTAKILAAV